MVASEITTLLTLTVAWSPTEESVGGVGGGVTSWDTSPPLGAGTIPREGVVADGAGFGVTGWVGAAPTPVAGLGLGTLALDEAGEVVERTALGAAEDATAEDATPALELGVNVLLGAFVAEFPTDEELAVWL